VRADCRVRIGARRRHLRAPCRRMIRWSVRCGCHSVRCGCWAVTR